MLETNTDCNDLRNGVKSICKSYLVAAELSTRLI